MERQRADPQRDWQDNDQAGQPGVTVRHFFPDQALLDGLQAERGKGRDDFPIPRLWRVVLLTILLRHSSFNPCLAELYRNPALGQLIGITHQDQIPHDWNRVSSTLLARLGADSRGGGRPWQEQNG